MNPTPLRQAVGAIVDGDATMQTLCGRATDLLVDWDSRHNATPPFVALLLVASTQEPDGGEVWQPLLQLQAVAQDLTVVDQLVHRLGEILTHANFWAQGIDAAPIGGLRQRTVGAQDEMLTEGWVFTLLELDLHWQVGAG